LFSCFQNKILSHREHLNFSRLGNADKELRASAETEILDLILHQLRPELLDELSVLHVKEFDSSSFVRAGGEEVAVVRDSHLPYARVVHEVFWSELASGHVEHLHSAAIVFVLHEQAMISVYRRSQEEVSLNVRAELEGHERFESFGTVDVCAAYFI